MTGVLWLGRKVAVWLMECVVRPVGRVVGPTISLSLLGPFAAAISALELAYAGPTFAAFDQFPAVLRVRRRGLAWRLDL